MSKTKKYLELLDSCTKLNIQCMDKSYVRAKHKCMFTCSIGHSWISPPGVINNGIACPICNNYAEQTCMQRLEAIVLFRQGKLRTAHVKNGSTLIDFECDKGHVWKTSGSGVINNGSWCPYCAGKKIKDHLDSLRQIATQHKGHLLTTSYLGQNTHHTWKCEKDHKFEAKPSNVRSGTWCSVCSSGLQERLARHAIELLFNCPFPKIRPAWLLNPKTKSALELDGYNEELGIALEYQGEQHYKLVKKYKMSKNELRSTQYRDQIKRDICTQHKILLVEIPYYIEPNDYTKFIFELVALAAPHFIAKMNHWSKVQMTTWVESQAYDLKDLQALAAEKQGKCISPIFLGFNKHHTWQCKEGHTWKAMPEKVKGCGNEKPTWCPYCDGQRIDKPYERLQALAAAKGGLCLSSAYINSHTKLLWQCKEGHEWLQKPAHITSGVWCPNCSKKKYGLADLRRVAASKNGLCLSEKYLGIKGGHKWQCANGHTWSMRWDYVNAGSWCRQCKGQSDPALPKANKITRSEPSKMATSILDLKSLALKNGGLCPQHK